jgi:hypothetical protein
MMPRLVKPELLDTLPSTNEEAQGSRRDLRRINRLMGHAGILARAWRDIGAEQYCSRIVDLGGGDGTLLLGVARRITSFSRIRSALIVDRQPLLSDATRLEFETLGCQVQIDSADIFEWLSEASIVPNTFVLANLFLHHFEGGDLRRLLQLIARRASGFAVCEPRRSALSLAASRLLGFIGCNRVTRHDAVVSVSGGFRGRELIQAWEESANWELLEREAGLFSHLFCGRRKVV